MAKGQREISVSEFFAKNRHLLGFDNPRKALLTTVKEAVDNSLDACEEAGILPDIYVGIEQLSETRFIITIRDNGPGIVRKQIENIFGKLLYGSKFHRLKMSRGQQGIGIAAAGMYGLMTTGKPMVIHTRPKKNKPVHRLELAIDTKKNKADVINDQEVDYEPITKTGTEVSIQLEGRYQRGKQSVDEYLKQTAIANPHAQFIFCPPDACKPKDENDTDIPNLIDDVQHAHQLALEYEHTTTTPGGIVVYPRAVHDLPDEPREIKPHPKGVELGMLMKMLKETDSTQLGGFLQSEFSRISLKVANELTTKAGLTNRTWVKNVDHAAAENLYKAIQDTRIMAPRTDCLAPIGPKPILAGLLKSDTKNDASKFCTVVTRPPAVYRGNPFQIEVGIVYGGSIPADASARVIRFANRVPLLYQQSACSAYKAVAETGWRNYGLTQPRGALPQGPLVIMIHMASVWVPFTSESKEAIADYDEIRKEMKLALSECGRKLKTYLSRRARMRREGERRDVFYRYIGEVVRAMHTIDDKFKPDKLQEQFEAVAKTRTLDADMEFDEDGNPVKKKERPILANDENTVVIEGETNAPIAEIIGDDNPKGKKGKKGKQSKSKPKIDIVVDEEDTLF